MLLQRGLDVNARDKRAASAPCCWPWGAGIRRQALWWGCRHGTSRARPGRSCLPGALGCACGHMPSRAEPGGTEDTCFLEPCPLRPGPLVPAVTLPVVGRARLWEDCSGAGWLGRASWRVTSELSTPGPARPWQGISDKKSIRGLVCSPHPLPEGLGRGSGGKPPPSTGVRSRLQAACMVPGGQGGRRRLGSGTSLMLGAGPPSWPCLTNPGFKAGPQPECFWGGSTSAPQVETCSRVLTEDLAPWAVGLDT